MSHFDPTFLTDPYRPPKDSHIALADLAPSDGEQRQFTVVSARRDPGNRFTLAVSPPTMLSCGLVTMWKMHPKPVGDWVVGETRPLSATVSAQWSADDGWRVVGATRG